MIVIVERYEYGTDYANLSIT